jgi:hypothetical protein
LQASRQPAACQRFDGAQAIERHVPEGTHRLRMGDAGQSQILERVVIHGEQDPTLMAHLEGKFKRAQKEQGENCRS